jgi:hypothetical protein
VCATSNQSLLLHAHVSAAGPGVRRQACVEQRLSAHGSLLLALQLQVLHCKASSSAVRQSFSLSWLRKNYLLSDQSSSPPCSCTPAGRFHLITRAFFLRALDLQYSTSCLVLARYRAREFSPSFFVRVSKELGWDVRVQSIKC